MDKETRLRLAEAVEKKLAFEEMMNGAGWKAFASEVERMRERALASVTSDVENHGKLARHAGRLDALLDVLKFPDKVIREGLQASEALNKRRNGDVPSDEE